MKGTTTLQLIDKTTGKVVKEVKHDNYITDLYKDYYTKHQEYHVTNIGQGLDLKFEDFAQGIILFGQAMPLSGCYLPRKDDVTIGYAYDLYSGADVKRGSLNELESGDITNGYRKVWDFGTGVAVGDIYAVSLTSNYGGSYDKDSFDTKFKYAKAISGYGDYHNLYSCCDISDDYMLYTYKYDGVATSFNFSDFRIVPFNSKSLEYKVNPRIYASEGNDDDNPRALRQDDITLEATPTDYTRASIPSIDNDYLYILYYKDATGFKLHRYNISTGAYVDELTYNFAYTAVPKKFKVTSTHIVWINGNDVYWIDKATSTEGSCLDVITSTSEGISALAISKKYSNTIALIGAKPYVYNEAGGLFAYVDISSGESWGEEMFDGGNSYAYSGGDGNIRWAPLSSLFIDEPYYLFGRLIADGGLDDGFSFGFFTGMPGRSLSTINNLPSTVTKATDQVLKVIYDITW